MRARGFSLIELVVAMGISAIVIAAAVALMVGTQRLFTTGTTERALQETARVALDEVTRAVKMAGYGMEPTFAFDFGQATTTMDRLGTGETARFGGYACDTPVSCRDSIAGPDELVFYSRDPIWARDLSGGVAATSLTLTGDVSDLAPGQILQIMCYGVASKWLWAYVTVQKATVSTGKIDLVPNTAQPNDFPLQNARLTGEPCFSTVTGQRRAFKIDRYRYHVIAVDASGTPRDPGTAGARPYLMLDQGLSDPDGNALEQVIAPDVEDLQVAYVFPLAAGGTAAAQLAGASAETRLVNGAAGIDLAPDLGIPSFSAPSVDPVRTTRHPANIRAVRIAITVRSDRADPAVAEALVPAVLNRPAIAGEVGYRRAGFESTAYVPNMENRLPVFPIYDPTYTAACAGTAGNCGGG